MLRTLSASYSFLIMAFVIFGAELYQFHTAMITMRTLFLMLLGAFEYDEMAEIHPFMAPVVSYHPYAQLCYFITYLPSICAPGHIHWLTLLSAR